MEVLSILFVFGALYFVSSKHDKHINRLYSQIDDLERTVAESKGMIESLGQDIHALQERVRESERDIFDLTPRRSTIDD